MASFVDVPEFNKASDPLSSPMQSETSTASSPAIQFDSAIIARAKWQATLGRGKPIYTSGLQVLQRDSFQADMAAVRFADTSENWLFRATASFAASVFPCRARSKT